MIWDGYLWVGKVHGADFIYRPMLSDERRLLLETGLSCGTPLLANWLRNRLLSVGNCEEDVNRVMLAFDADPQTVFGVASGILPPGTEAPWSHDWELRYAENLVAGVALERDAPHFARRDCGMCKEWWYRDGEDGDGTIVRDRRGQPLRRPAGTATLCQTNEGCPKGTPESSRALNPINRLAYEHYRRCEATGRFPDDAIVARNALIIRKVLRGSR